MSGIQPHKPTSPRSPLLSHPALHHGAQYYPQPRTRSQNAPTPKTEPNATEATLRVLHSLFGPCLGLRGVALGYGLVLAGLGPTPEASSWASPVGSKGRSRPRVTTSVRYQNSRNYGSIVYLGSRRICIINRMTKHIESLLDARLHKVPGSPQAK